MSDVSNVEPGTRRPVFQPVAYEHLYVARDVDHFVLRTLDPCNFPYSLPIPVQYERLAMLAQEAMAHEPNTRLYQRSLCHILVVNRTSYIESRTGMLSISLASSVSTL